MSYFSPSRADVDKRNIVRPEAETRTPVSPKTAAAPSVSTLGRDMLVTGNIVCAGAVHVAGRVIGDIHAAHLVIGEGAHVEGKVTAQEAVVQGTFKGTIHGNSVKLQGTAVVVGEVFNKSLIIEQDVQFEGISRRIEKPVELPSAEQRGKPTPSPTASVIPLSGAGG